MLVTACGGGGSADVAEAGLQPVAVALASGTTIFQIDMQTLPAEVAAQTVEPAFHMAPMLLDTPDDTDRDGAHLSAHRHARRHTLPTDAEGISTRQLTPQLLGETRQVRRHAHRARDLAPMDTSITPMAATSAVSTYTPAQIRAAYGLPALPAPGTALSAAQAAQLGAGQTIYIVDAMHNPNVAAELAAFNQKFGLPTCTTQAIAITAALPLPAAPVSGCQLSIVYSTATGTMTTATPAYNSGWATEISLDVQWAHATAPLARIVLIEAADASINSLTGGVKLANAMGPGAVSMSFGAIEGSWTASVDAAFSASNMTYLAATGDSGAAVSWPAVSTKVVAVGGTSLTYSGTGTRSETVWSGTGGGTSLYTLKPAYQTSAVPGMGTYSGRAVADVAFNADPSTGQYVAVMTPGSTAVSWISAGGTSMSTPQWAGLIAIANAARALSGKAALGSPHAALYNQIATVPGTYASAFADITQGFNGTCGVICTSRIGYDTPSGLGTPNVANLVNALAGVAVTATAPVVSSASISGQVGTALTFTASVTAPNAVTYALTGAPSGMTISTAGIVSWATPVVGTYNVTVTAKDTKTNLSGQGVYTVTITPPQPPAVSSATISGKVGTALSFSAASTSTNAVTYTLTGAPSGMAISSTGVVSWANPVLGTYNVTVTAKDSKTGLSGQGVYTVKIATNGPTISAPAATGAAGKVLKGTITISDPAATSLSISISGAPLGMGFSASGLSITYTWNSPVVGSYNLKVSVVDSLGLTAQATVPITITAK
jgi:subtilase family serine protease